MLEDDDHFNKADVCLYPPNDGADSDEDSGGEDDATPNNLSGKQLSAPGVAVIHREYSEKDIIGEGDGQTDSDGEDDDSDSREQVCYSVWLGCILELKYVVFCKKIVSIPNHVAIPY